MKYFKATVLFAMMALSGCATMGESFYKSASSGQIGCAEQETQISNLASSLRSQSWEASCRGKQFYCTSVSSAGIGSNQVTCKESLK